ncbi:hypothetical protein QYF61_011577 [Mycteria americana]|uniref:Lipocalin/cytosolic fatty-acid binding domain-containing protein n=1 Tax=Mycteria americana TaxID=33587 RepID=A0AAN7MRC4_MYCAM|nr:hypothetical protein QYF61_011577 [Mycteria americana]
MRTAGLSLGLALLCLLRAEAEGLGALGLDKSKVIRSISGKGREGTTPPCSSGLTACPCCQIAGKWHIIALASDSESYLQKKDELKMAMASITVLGEGDLKVSFAIPTPEGCKKSEAIYRQTGTPGEYYSSERGNKTAQVVDTDGKTYAIIFASRVKDGKTLHMLRLYSA